MCETNYTLSLYLALSLHCLNLLKEVLFVCPLDKIQVKRTNCLYLWVAQRNFSVSNTNIKKLNVSCTKLTHTYTHSQRRVCIMSQLNFHAEIHYNIIKRNKGMVRADMRNKKCISWTNYIRTESFSSFHIKCFHSLIFWWFLLLFLVPFYYSHVQTMKNIISCRNLFA